MRLRRGGCQAHEFIQKQPLDLNQIEFEMLYGIAFERLKHMKERGYRTRIYLPYGKEWYLYVCHRIAEYPPNLYQALVDAARLGDFHPSWTLSLN